MSALSNFRNANPSPASPTSTTYSGISNYRTDSYKPLRDTKGAPAVPQIDPKIIAKTHFDELNIFLESHMAKEPPGSRASAREKLTRLTRQQFQELSTDVYDELVRRKNNTSKNEVPFLPVRDEFHPKRNQARQKLATLPKTRFKDLSSDVFVELGRRYPELKEPETLTPLTPGSFYDDAQSPMETPPPPPLPNNYNTQNGRVRSPEEKYRTSYDSQPTRRPSQDQGRPSQDDQGDRPKPQRSPTANTYGTGYRTTSPEAGPSAQRRPSSSSSYGARQSQQQDPYGSNGRAPARKPSSDYQGLPYQSRKGTGDSQQTYPGPQSQQGMSSAAATSGVIIPNKSMIAEEEIKVPFGREGDDESSSSRAASPDGMRISMRSAGTDPNAPRSPDGRSPLDRLGQGQSFSIGGLNALGANLASPRSEDEEDAGSDRRAPSEYFDKMSLGRASVQSDVSGKGGRVRQSLEDSEKLRRDYEFKIATMQSRMASLEGSLLAANKARDEEVERARELEEEIRNLRDAAAKRTAEVQSLQGELEDALESKDREVRRADSDRREMARLQERVLALESEQNSAGHNAEVEESLREEVQGLLDALRESSNRNEELMADKDADMLLVQTLNNQVKDYKKKYEQAKTELRNTKATSQLYTPSQGTKVDLRRMPIAETGVIGDIYVTRFQASIDNLLNVARSENTGNVLTAMTPVVNHAASIINDVKSFEQNPNRFDISEDTVRHLRERCEATLQNLTSAARNHAQSFGLSPVSLMDAAASHVSVAVIDLVKLLLLRRVDAAERDGRNTRSPTEYGSLNNSNNNGNHNYKSSMRSIDEMRGKSPHNRAPSSGSNRARDEDYGQQRSMSNATMPSSLGSAMSPPSSSQTFDDVTTTAGGISDDSATLAGGDNSWSELKPYLDAQSESLVYNIQNLLNSIRRGANMNELEENLTQIITIVSSIVAVCKDSFPSNATQRGGEILRDLSDNCNKLSEMQSYTEITKTTRTAMATASFGVAKAMKELMKL